MLKFLKTRSGAAVVLVLVVVLGTLFGVNSSMAKQYREIASVKVNAASGMKTVLNNYPEVEDSLTNERNALRELVNEKASARKLKASIGKLDEVFDETGNELLYVAESTRDRELVKGYTFDYFNAPELGGFARRVLIHLCF